MDYLEKVTLKSRKAKEDEMLGYLETRLATDSVEDPVFRDVCLEPLDPFPTEGQLRYAALMLNLTDTEGNPVEGPETAAIREELKLTREANRMLPDGKDYWRRPEGSESGVTFQEKDLCRMEMTSKLEGEDLFRFKRMFWGEAPVSQEPLRDVHCWVDFHQEPVSLPKPPPPDPYSMLQPDGDEDNNKKGEQTTEGNDEMIARALANIKFEDNEGASSGEVKVAEEPEEDLIKPEDVRGGNEGEFFALEVEDSTDEEGEAGRGTRAGGEDGDRMKYYEGSVRGGALLDFLLDLEDDPEMQCRHPLMREADTTSPREVLYGRFDKALLEEELVRIRSTKEEPVAEALRPPPKKKAVDKLEKDYLRKLAEKSSDRTWEIDSDEEEANPNHRAPIQKPQLPDKKSTKPPPHAKKKRDPHNKKKSWKMMANVFED